MQRVLIAFDCLTNSSFWILWQVLRSLQSFWLKTFWFFHLAEDLCELKLIGLCSPSRTSLHLTGFGQWSVNAVWLFRDFCFAVNCVIPGVQLKSTVHSAMYSPASVADLWCLVLCDIYRVAGTLLVPKMDQYFSNSWLKERALHWKGH